MLYLLLAIVSSCLISIVLKYASNKIENDVAMFLSNYFICAILSFLYLDKRISITINKDINFALVLGAITGALYLINFLLYKRNIDTNGVVMSVTFMKLGVIIPTLIAIFIFKEQPSINQIIGIILVVISIIAINYKKDNFEFKKFGYLLILLLIESGINDSMSNIFDKMGNTNYKDIFLLTIFVSALICAIIVCLLKKVRIHKEEIIYGILVGIPNYYSARFLLLALKDVEAIIAFPAYSVGTIVLISILGLLLFKEKLSKQKMISILIILVSLVLLNI